MVIKDTSSQAANAGTENNESQTAHASNTETGNENSGSKNGGGEDQELPLDPGECAALLKGDAPKPETTEKVENENGDDDEDEEDNGEEAEIIEEGAEDEVAEVEQQSEEVEEGAENEQGNENGEGGDKRPLPNRISTAQFSTVEQEAIATLRELRKEDPKATLRDALDLVEVRRAGKGEAGEVEAGEEQTGNEAVELEATAEISSEIETLRGKVTELEDKRTELLNKKREMSKGGQLYTDEHVDLDEELESVRNELADAKAEVKTAERQQQSATEQARTAHINAREEVKASMLKVYGSAGDGNTRLGKEVAKVIVEMSKPSHPDHEVLKARVAPKFVIEEAVLRVSRAIAKEKNISVAQARESLKTKPSLMRKPGSGEVVRSQETQIPTRKFTPASGGKTTVRAAQPQSAQAVLDEVGFNPKAAAAALGSSGSKTSAFVIR